MTGIIFFLPQVRRIVNYEGVEIIFCREKQRWGIYFDGCGNVYWANIVCVGSNFVVFRCIFCGMFLCMLEYKLADRGRHFVKVDKWYPSSQKCYCCDRLHPEMKDLRMPDKRAC